MNGNLHSVRVCVLSLPRVKHNLSYKVILLCACVYARARVQFLFGGGVVVVMVVVESDNPRKPYKPATPLLSLITLKASYKDPNASSITHTIQ